MQRPLIQLFALAALATVLVGCNIVTKISSNTRSLQGTGPVKSETRTVTDFDKLEVGGNFQVVVKVGPSTSVKLEAQENLVKAIEAKVEGGVLKVASEENLVSDKPILVTITTPKLVSVSGSGAVSLNVEGIQGTGFRADLSGASKLKAAGTADEVKLEGSGGAEIVWDGLTSKSLAVSMSGGGSTLVSGSSDSLALDMSGGSTFKGEKFATKAATADTSGGCSVVVNAKDTLSIHSSGGGSIRYIGNPTLSQDVSGGVEVSRVP
ncbi:MAG: head GIN domain-containing protein [Fimbriimonas sp.]